MAAVRAFAGEHDRDFCQARIGEVRRLLHSPPLNSAGVTADRVDTVHGYRIWSQTYDRPGNGLFTYEEPVVHAIVDSLPPGAALDAACGTGRWSLLRIVPAAAAAAWAGVPAVIVWHFQLTDR